MSKINTENSNILKNNKCKDINKLCNKHQRDNEALCTNCKW